MKKLLAVSAAVVLWGSVALAQVGSSTISGRVVDGTGAVVPNVSVSAVQVTTNFTFKAVTNADGLYRIPSLAPGAYRVTFEAAGFKKTVRDDVDLRTGDNLAVDVALQVGSVSEAIEVTGTTPLLETETSATGSLVEGETLKKLPLYQRYVNSTLNLVPGMTMGGYGYGGDFGAFHIAGQRNSTIGLFEDGVNANEQLSGTVGIKPVQGAVEEVKVLSTTLPAEYGHSAGGVLAVVKKSGTNELHGLAADFGRSRRMTHRLYFDRLRTSDPQPGNPNGVPSWFMHPEANVGGPIVLPKLYNGRNKTFFFFAYQKLIEKKAAQVLVNTPTDAMKAGDVSYGGVGQAIYDPATTRQNADGTWARDPFPSKSVPASRFDPVARKILGFNPWVAPNAPGGFSPTGPVTNLITNENSRTFFEDYSGRIDHQFSPNFKIYGSYTYNHQSGLNRPTNIIISDFDGSQGFESPFTGQNYSIGKTWVINPSMVNDARVGYYRRRNDQFSYSAGENWAQQLGIPGVSAELMPQFGASGADRYGESGLWGLIGNGNNRQINETISFRDDLTKIHGTHSFKAGYELLRFRLNSTVTNRPSGAFFFDGMTAGLQPNGASLPNTGSTWAGFLLGSVRQALFDSELTSWLPRSSIHSFYFQDDWKVKPNLTLNLGVRYSNESPFTTKYGLMSNFDPAGNDTVVAGAKGAIIHPSGGLNSRDNNNFQPRIGAAWHARQKLVVRGGFAVNTVDVKFPLLRAQFDEYVAQVNLQRAPGDPRQLFQISNGPGAINVPVRSDGTSGFIGTNYSGRNVEYWDPESIQPAGAQLELQCAIPALAELPPRGFVPGLVRCPPSGEVEPQYLPHRLRQGQSHAAEPGAGGVAEFPSVPQLRQRQSPLQFRSFHVSRRHHQSGQALCRWVELQLVLYLLEGHQQPGQRQRRLRRGSHSKSQFGEGACQLRPQPSFRCLRHLSASSRPREEVHEPGRRCQRGLRRMGNCLDSNARERQPVHVRLRRQPLQLLSRFRRQPASRRGKDPVAAARLGQHGRRPLQPEQPQPDHRHQQLRLPRAVPPAAPT